MKFYKAWPDAPSPKKGGKYLSGEIPSRAHQFCEPFLVANGIGHLIYPPINFNLYWDGHKAYIQLESMEEWITIDRIFLPDSIDLWREAMPESHLSCLPAFIEAFPERGVLQVWTGLYVKTQPGDSLWIRSPVNVVSDPAYRVIEGIIETDWWTGPLFTNFELIKTDTQISFNKNTPMLQVFRIPREYHQDTDRCTTEELNAESPKEVLDSMLATSLRRMTERPGSYKRVSKGYKNAK